MLFNAPSLTPFQHGTNIAPKPPKCSPPLLIRWLAAIKPHFPDITNSGSALVYRTAKIKSWGLRPGTLLLLCDPKNNRSGRDGELAPFDTITFRASGGGSTVLTVASASKFEIVAHNPDGMIWRLGPTLPSDLQTGFRQEGRCSEWTIRARSN
jgi:hypothetical protein